MNDITSDLWLRCLPTTVYSLIRSAFQHPLEAKLLATQQSLMTADLAS